MDTCGRSRAESKSASAVSLPRVQNLFLQRKCACGGSSGLTGSCSECEKKKLLGHPLQTKLRINEPGDEYEQEADRMAEQVMRMAGTDFKSSVICNLVRRCRGASPEMNSQSKRFDDPAPGNSGRTAAVESVPLKRECRAAGRRQHCPSRRI